MNIAMILAAGVGQRMRSAGLPKQFLKLYGKPIIIYTLEKFEDNPEIDKIVVVCREGYTDQLEELLQIHHIQKVAKMVLGGNDRQASLLRGLQAIKSMGAAKDDIVIIHDGVRPMILSATISENIRIAREYGCAVTVHPVTESVVITDSVNIGINDFKKRADTYSLTAPQSFRLGELLQAYKETTDSSFNGMPLLDAAMVYAKSGRSVHLVKEQGPNIKITTPEDFYYLKAMIELEENKYIFGL